MVTLLVILALSQAPPGPLDAFRANYASIKAEMDFEFTWVSFKDNRRLWEGQVPVSVELHVEDRDLTTVGHWACDGNAEYFRFSSPEKVFDRASKDHLTIEANKVSYKVLFIPRVEAIWDGEVLFGHLNHPHFMHRKKNPDWQIVRAVVISDEDVHVSYLSMGSGPFQWEEVFPHVLKTYGAAAPRRRQAMMWGHPAEVEIYRKEIADGMSWNQLEVAYDPSIGYLPRFVRSLLYYPPRKIVRVYEMYLIEARPCAAGGFVPTEWYDINFEMPDFQSRFPNYDGLEDLDPPMTKAYASHFQSAMFRNFSGPVALTDIKDVRSIAAVGGTKPRPANSASLSLTDVKTVLGGWITTPPQRTLLNLDRAELRELERPPSGSWWGYIVALTVVVLGTAWYLRWRRARNGIAALALAVLGGASGCGRLGDPVIKLTAAYRESFVYIDSRMHELPMALMVRNDGYQALRLLKADGGCSCRKVDQSSFPVVVGAGGSVVIPVKLSITPRTMPQGSQFQLDTDKGAVVVSAPFFTLVSHESSPEILVNNYMYPTFRRSRVDFLRISSRLVSW